MKEHHRGHHPPRNASGGGVLCRHWVLWVPQQRPVRLYQRGEDVDWPAAERLLPVDLREAGVRSRLPAAAADLVLLHEGCAQGASLQADHRSARALLCLVCPLLALVGARECRGSRGLVGVSVPPRFDSASGRLLPRHPLLSCLWVAPLLL